MAISLKKHTPGAGEQESARLNDVNQNWGTIEQAINDIQANASLYHYTASKSGDGINPYITFAIPVPSGYTADAAIVHHRSNGLMFPYNISFGGTYFVIVLNTHNNQPASSVINCYVDVWFRKV